MDLFLTFVIIGIIGLAVAPFFLLSGAFGAPKRPRDRNDGPVIPVTPDVGAELHAMGRKRPDSDDEDADLEVVEGDGGGNGQN